MIEITNPVLLDIWREERELQKNQEDYYGEELNEVENGKRKD